MSGDMDELVAIAKVLGLAGVGVSVFFLLIKSVIEKNIYPQLTKDKSYRLLRYVITVVFAFSVIVLIFVFFYNFFHDKNVSFELERGDTKVVILATKQTFSDVVVTNAKATEAKSGVSVANTVVQMGSAYEELAIIVDSMNAVLDKDKNCLPAELIAKVQVETRFAKSDALNKAFDAITSGKVCGAIVNHSAKFGDLIGRYEELTSQPSSAETIYAKVLEFAPTDLIAARALAALRIQRADQEGAMIAINTLIDSETPIPSGVELAQALTERAEIFMWMRRFNEALADVDRAFKILDQVRDVDADAERDAALGSLLNLSSGLQMQLGNFAEAEKYEEQALKVFSSTKSRRDEFTARTNVISIFIETGQLGRAVEYVGVADKDVNQLAELDILRGNYFIIKARLALRYRNFDQASSFANAAEVFYSKSGPSHYNFRLANVECLREKLSYFAAKYDDAKEHGDFCISTKRAPGKVDNICDAVYILVKTSVKEKSEDRWRRIFSELISEGSKLDIDDRIRLTSRFAETIAQIVSNIDANQISDVRAIGSEFSKLEYETGFISDVFNDILITLEAGKFVESGDKPLANVNVLRSNFGAREFQY
jgi:tetratricopeptide (TPR) repeat protein